MKIETSSVQHPVVGTKSATRASGASEAATSAAAGKSAVDLSPAARQLSNLQNSDNDINVERVNALRDAIASGQLKINPDQIADAVIASARELLKQA